MKTKSKKPVSEEPKVEIINAVVSDVEMYYAYDMPNHIEIFFKKDSGGYEDENKPFASFYFGFNKGDDGNNLKNNLGEVVGRFFKVFRCECFRFKGIIETPMRLKIRRIKHELGPESIEVLAISHITCDTWLEKGL